MGDVFEQTGHERPRVSGGRRWARVPRERVQKCGKPIDCGVHPGRQQRAHHERGCSSVRSPISAALQVCAPNPQSDSFSRAHCAFTHADSSTIRATPHSTRLFDRAESVEQVIIVGQLQPDDRPGLPEYMLERQRVAQHLQRERVDGAAPHSSPLPPNARRGIVIGRAFQPSGQRILCSSLSTRRGFQQPRPTQGTPRSARVRSHGVAWYRGSCVYSNRPSRIRRIVGKP